MCGGHAQTYGKMFILLHIGLSVDRALQFVFSMLNMRIFLFYVIFLSGVEFPINPLGEC